jgi:hypothetical protein
MAPFWVKVWFFKLRTAWALNANLCLTFFIYLKFHVVIKSIYLFLTTKPKDLLPRAIKNFELNIVLSFVGANVRLSDTAIIKFSSLIKFETKIIVAVVESWAIGFQRYGLSWTTVPF